MLQGDGHSARGVSSQVTKERRGVEGKKRREGSTACCRAAAAQRPAPA